MARPLPHNKEAEAAVLGGVLLRNDALNEVVTIVTEEDFYVPAFRSVFKAMIKLADRGQPIDIVTLEHQLRAADELGLIGGIEGLNKLTDRYASSHNIASHAELIRQQASIRNLVVACQEIAEEGRADVEDVGTFIDGAERRLLEVNQSGRQGTYRSAKDLIHGVFENITERAKLKNPITGVPTLYAKMDEMTGGMQPGDLVILAARPSMGKTALALNLCQNACIMQERHSTLPEDERPARYPVLFFSLEMSAAQLIERILCSEARVDASKLRGGRLVEDEFARLVRAADRVYKAPLFIDDSAAPTILEIRARARRFRQDRSIFPPPTDADDRKRKQLGMIVVDYLQLCRGGGRYDMREQEISEISRGLKAIAKELEVPVLALSQLNRGVDSRADHRPQLSDLRECVTGDTLVFLADGRRVPIAHLEGCKPEVLAMTEQGKLEPAHSDAVWRVGRRPVFEVTLASGRRIRATAKHRLYGARGWVRVGELQIGDRLAIARNSDLSWDRVTSIEAVGEEDVFDLTVPGPASWLADGIVSHNSGAIEQDADVIMFIYRQERYETDEEKRKQVEGQAEVIIGKQRNGPTGTVHLTFIGKHTRFENAAFEGPGGH